MLFNSTEYLLFFLIICHVGWLLVKRPTWRIWVLLAASYYFYASNNGWLLLLILASTQIDYICGLRIAASTSPRRRKLYLLLSMTANLAILGYFKYSNFFLDSFVAVGQNLGLPLEFQPWHIVLPVGISFYTFQSMSYTIDVYRGDVPAERSWSRFAFYVAYFPQLVAGPIMRAADFMPQLRRRPELDLSALERSIAVIFRGLIKKIVLADGILALHAEAAFDAASGVDSFVAWLGLLAFSFQIYFDFSGYSDIAIGCSRLMGYHIPDNFRLPYAAVSFSDFWRRWHISLSSWLRDYLYIPLGGNRMTSPAGVYRNIMIVMLLGGLWHGAAWNFVIWGGLHGLFLVLERMFHADRPPADGPLLTARMMLRRGTVFGGVLVTWVVFRGTSLAGIQQFCESLTSGGLPAAVTVGQVSALVVIVVSYAMQLVCLRHEPLDVLLRWPLPLRCLVYAVTAVAIVVFNSEGPQAFIYFQF